MRKIKPEFYECVELNIFWRVIAKHLPWKTVTNVNFEKIVDSNVQDDVPSKMEEKFRLLKR